MSGMINKLKEAITGEPVENPKISSTASGHQGGRDAGYGTEVQGNSNIDSEYGSTNRNTLGSNTGSGLRGDNTTSHSGLSSGVEGSRLTNAGQTGQIGRDSTSGVGQGFPGSTGHTGSSDKYGQGIESKAAGAGIAGMEHHGRQGEGLTGSTGTGTLGSHGRNERDLENRGDSVLETGIAGAGRSGEYSSTGRTGGSGLTGNTGTTGTSGLSRADIESRIEPHHHVGENFDEYASPSAFSHGKHHGVRGTGLGSGTTGEYDSNTSGTGITGQGIGSGTGRHTGTGNEYSSSGRNDPYDNQTGSNAGSGTTGTAPHNSSLLNKLDPRVDTNQSNRNM